MKYNDTKLKTSSKELPQSISRPSSPVSTLEACTCAELFIEQHKQNKTCFQFLASDILHVYNDTVIDTLIFWSRDTGNFSCKAEHTEQVLKPEKLKNWKYLITRHL